jgi:hypothetical protein
MFYLFTGRTSWFPSRARHVDKCVGDAVDAVNAFDAAFIQGLDNYFTAATSPRR